MHCKPSSTVFLFPASTLRSETPDIIALVDVDTSTTDGFPPLPPSISIGRQERDAQCRHRIFALGRLLANKFDLIYISVPQLDWGFGSLPKQIFRSQSTQQKLFRVELRGATWHFKTRKSHIKIFQGILAMM